MKFMKDIKPYNKYWGNCVVNMFLSIIKDSSYETMIYLNDYKYCFRDDGMFLDYTQEYYHALQEDIFTVERYNFKDCDNFIPELKKMIMSEKYVLMYVDLFYWIEDGLFYNKVHMPHSSLITGFNEEEGLFYVLEDDKNAVYEIKEITEKRMLEAFNSPYKKPAKDYTLISSINSNRMPEFKLEKSAIINTTQKLISHLTDLIDDEESRKMDAMLTYMEYPYMFAIDCGKVNNRFYGNTVLFRIIREQGFITEECMKEFNSRAQNIGYKWSALKSIIMKAYYNNEFPDIDGINSILSEVFRNEKDMWDDFLNKNLIPDNKVLQKIIL